MNPFQFSLIVPPKLSVYDRLSIISFLSEWDQYSADVTRLNSSLSSETVATYKAVPLRDCIDLSLLFTLCVYDIGISESKIPTLSDDELLPHLRNSISEIVTVPLNTTELFRSIKFVHFDDPMRSVHDLFGQCRSIISSYGLSSLFEEHADLRAQQINVMISAVHPDVLRNSLRNRLRLDKIDCRSDLQKFFKFMVETLKSYRLFNPVLSGSVTSSVPARHSGSAVTRQPRHVQCFHCQQPHHIKECPTCPPDVAARIMRDFSTHHTRSPANKPVSSGSNTATIASAENAIPVSGSATVVLFSYIFFPGRKETSSSASGKLGPVCFGLTRIGQSIPTGPSTFFC